MGKLLNKSDIFAAAKKGFEPRTVYVGAWGGDVLYKPMTMEERREVRKRASSTTSNASGDTTVEIDQELLELWAIITCTIDPADSAQQRLMFDPSDLHALQGQFAAGPLSVLSMAILKASGLGKDDSFRGEPTKTEDGAGSSADDADV